MSDEQESPKKRKRVVRAESTENVGNDRTLDPSMLYIVTGSAEAIDSEFRIRMLQLPPRLVVASSNEEALAKFRAFHEGVRGEYTIRLLSADVAAPIL